LFQTPIVSVQSENNVDIFFEIKSHQNKDILSLNNLFHILDKFVDSFGKMIFLKSLDVFVKKIKEEGC